MSFREFYKDYCTSNVKKNINCAVALLYLCSVTTMVISIVATKLGLGVMASILDAILILVLGLGIHIWKSRACAVIVLAYSIFNCLYALITTGRPAGYLIVIAGVLSTVFTFKARQEYKEYIGG